MNNFLTIVGLFGFPLYYGLEPFLELLLTAEVQRESSVAVVVKIFILSWYIERDILSFTHKMHKVINTN